MENYNNKQMQLTSDVQSDSWYDSLHTMVVKAYDSLHTMVVKAPPHPQAVEFLIAKCFVLLILNH